MKHESDRHKPTYEELKAIPDKYHNAIGNDLNLLDEVKANREKQDKPVKPTVQTVQK